MGGWVGRRIKNFTCKMRNRTGSRRRERERRQETKGSNFLYQFCQSYSERQLPSQSLETQLVKTYLMIFY
jgi:hypothetical protein